MPVEIATPEAIERGAAALRAGRLVAFPTETVYGLGADATNARAVADDAPGVSIEIAGHAFTQKPQRYAAKAFAELKRKRAAHYDSAALTALLEETGCEPFLSSPPMESSGADEEEGDDAGDDAED